MKFRLQIIFTNFILLLVASCGGGGSTGDGLQPLTVNPTSVTLTGPPDICASGKGPTVFVYGGTPPYIINNPAPDRLLLSTNKINESTEGVTISVNGACFDTLSLTFVDSDKNYASVSVSNVKGPKI
jgi:hypothetical protein